MGRGKVNLLPVNLILSGKLCKIVTGNEKVGSFDEVKRQCH